MGLQCCEEQCCQMNCNAHFKGIMYMTALNVIPVGLFVSGSISVGTKRPVKPRLIAIKLVLILITSYLVSITF